MTYSLHPFPPCLANCEGTLAKTNKSTLARHAEGLAESNQAPSSSSCACIVDGIALLQEMKSVPETFRKFAEKVLH